MTRIPTARSRHLLFALLTLCAVGLSIVGAAAAQFRPPVVKPPIQLSVPSDPCDAVWAYLEDGSIIQAGRVSVNGSAQYPSPAGMTGLDAVNKNSFTGAHDFSGSIGSRDVEVSFRRSYINRKLPYAYSAIVDVCTNSSCSQRYTMNATPTECIATERGATVILRDDASDYTAVIYFEDLIPFIGG